MFNERLKKLQKRLAAEKTSVCLIENTTDLFYLTGLHMSAGSLYVTPKTAHLFVDGRYLQAVQEKCPIPSSLSEGKKIELFLEKNLRGGIFAFDREKTSFARYEKFRQLQLSKKISFILRPASPFLKEIRAIKDKEELKKMRQSAELLWKGFLHLQRIVKVGMSEKEIALAFELFCRKEGAEGLAFEPIIAFGPNSALPHHRAGATVLKKGTLILVDIGVVFQSYHSDMTRVLFPAGSSAFLKKMYGIIQEAQRAALQLCKPGVKVKELDLAARRVMAREGVEERFLHGLGHGIGLETHEFPRLKYNGEDKDVSLEEGMVITIEPGLYFPGKGGVRYEDTIIITKKGYDNLYP